MNKKWIAALAAAGVLVGAVGVTALAGGLQKPTVTCPECGAEFELEMPEREGRGMGREPMTAEAFAAQLDEKVANGELTQEEADSQLAEFEARQAEMEQQRAEMEAQRKAELDEKVANGELTQEEADKLLEQPGGMGPGGFGGGKGPGGPGGPHGEMPNPPEDGDAPEVPAESSDDSTQSAA